MYNNIAELEQSVVLWCDDALQPIRANLFTYDLMNSVPGQTLAGQNPTICGPSSGTAQAIGALIEAEIAASGVSPKAIQDLLNSPANAVSTVLGIAQTRSKWNPVNPEDSDAAAKFAKYTQNVSAFPLLVLQNSSTNNLKYQETDYNDLITKIVDLYVGIADSDKGKIKSSLNSIIQACTSRVNTQNTQTLFSQSTLSVDGGITSLYISSSTVVMEYDYSTGKGAPRSAYKTDITVSQAQYLFNTAAFSSAMASALLKATYTSVDQWITDGTTPQSTKYVKFCFN